MVERNIQDKGQDPNRTASTRLALLVADTLVTAIGDKLGLSPKTINTYRTRILEKLNLDSTAQLIRYLVERGLLD